MLILDIVIWFRMLYLNPSQNKGAIQVSEKLITIAAFYQPIEADLAKSKLESEDIECFIADQHVIQWRVNAFFS